MSPNSSSHDVVVVGARVAGASVALHLARAGFDVLVLERTDALGPTFSSHQMNIVGSECLDAWGLYDDLLSSDCPGMSEMMYDLGEMSVVAKVPAVGDLAQLHYCKREVLDNILIGQAIRAGARVQFGVSFRALTEMDERGVTVEVERPGATPHKIHTRFLIGADGRRSNVARALGAQQYNVMDERALTCFGYFRGHVTDRLEVYMANTGSVALFPTNDSETCAVLVQRPSPELYQGMSKAALLNTAIAARPALKEKLDGCVGNPRVYRFAGAPGYFRQPYAGRCALVGDAGYYRDPIVGDGIADAMVSAELLAGQVTKVLRGAPTGPALETYKAVRDAHFYPEYERTRKFLRFEYDLEALTRRVRGSASGPMILRRVVDTALAANRRTRRDMLRLLDEAETAATDPKPRGTT